MCTFNDLNNANLKATQKFNNKIKCQVVRISDLSIFIGLLNIFVNN